MKLYKNVLFGLSVVAFALVITSCQKLYRPPFKPLIADPTPPPFSALKDFFQFENNANDEGENKLTSTAKNVTYVTGISGQAAKFGPDGYLLFKAAGDTIKYPNEFVGLPADTLKSLGSFTVSLWMNVPGPFTDGAQGVFSFSNKTQFWGNLDMFLENYNNAADQSEAYIKFHMFNAGVASGLGEEWSETKVTAVFNKWTHIALTYNASDSKLNLYVDGKTTGISNKVLGGGSYGKIKYNDFNGLVLGTHQFQTVPSLTNHGPEGWAKSLNGALDQFRIYTRALTAAEVTDLFNTKK